MPIAIVGMGFRGPGDATSVENLWKMISEGQESWSKIPKHKWNHEAFYHPDANRHGTVSCYNLSITLLWELTKYIVQCYGWALSPTRHNPVGCVSYPWEEKILFHEQFCSSNNKLHPTDDYHIIILHKVCQILMNHIVVPMFPGPVKLTSNVAVHSFKCQPPKLQLWIPSKDFCLSVPMKQWKTPGQLWNNSVAAIPLFLQVHLLPITRIFSGEIQNQLPCINARTRGNVDRTLRIASPIFLTFMVKVWI
jgi:hypothetical protein